MNGVDLDRVLREAESLLRSYVPARAALVSERRPFPFPFPLRLRESLSSPIREGLRRLKRSTLLFFGIIAALIAYSLFVAPIGFPNWLFAILAAYGLAFLALFWPTRRRAKKDAEPASHRDDLGVSAGALRLARRDQLPSSALSAADAILARLHELRPHLQALDPRSQLAGDAQRLIGKHLPSLVNAYLALPQSSRHEGSESGRRLAEGLGMVATELDGLLAEASRDRHQEFETQWRFIETRYKDTGFETK